MGHPFHGVVSIDVEPDSISTRCATYVPLLGPGQCFSHATAALIYGMPLPSRLIREPRLHVASTDDSERPRGRGIIGHELYSEHVEIRLWRGLPTLSPADTWCYLAPTLAPDDLVAVGDFLVSGVPADGGRTPPFETHQSLEAAVRRHHGKRGIRSARLALPALRTGVDSRPETLMRLLIVQAGLPEPLVNPGVPVDNGTAVLHPDLAWPGWRIVLEYEGDGHRSDPRQFRADIRRRERFEAAGWRVIRVTADDLFVDTAAFLARVRAVIASRLR